MSSAARRAHRKLYARRCYVTRPPEVKQSAWERFLASGRKKPVEIRRFVMQNRRKVYIPEEVLEALGLQIYERDFLALG